MVAAGFKSIIDPAAAVIALADSVFLFKTSRHPAAKLHISRKVEYSNGAI